jgi:Carboxypeptidase regulatory-like domain/TonB dependent receptor-like, beta-barrel
MNRLSRLLSATTALLAAAHVAAAQPVALRVDTGPARAEAVTARAALGSLSGIVSDDRGAPLEGVMVSATGATIAFALTDPTGRYSFDRLPSGEYLLRAHLTGFVASRREFVEIRASSDTVRLIQLRRAADAVGTAGVPTRSILTAGVALPGESQAGPSEDPDAAAGKHPHDERAWRLRHLKRSVLKEESGAVVAEAAPAEAASADAVAALFAGFPFTGELNLLTTGVFDSAGELFTGERAPRGVAYLAIGAPAGMGDWNVRAALTQGDVSSWILSGAYVARGARTHAFDVGLSYGAQEYRGISPTGLALASEGDRHVGMLYGFDHWTVSRRLQVSYGARLSYYDYLDRDGLLSPRVGVSVMPLERTWVRAIVSQRLLAPGAEEFLPPPSQTMWLPPERTFAPLVGNEFLVERTRHAEIGVEHEFDDAYVVGLRRFYQHVDDQLVTLFGLRAENRPRSELGHYFVANAGGFDADGWGLRFASPLAPRLRGSVDYTLTRARWSSAGDADVIERWSPSARREEDEFHDVTTAVETEIPETATRVFVLYRINSGYARSEPETVRPGLDARFDVQVKQALPFLPFGSQWEVLVAVRNLFREPTDVASVYDELLVVRPPKRLVGGVQVRF